MKYKLAERYPELAVEFHPTKNYPLTINSIAKWGNLDVWWTCKHKHHYQKKIRLKLKSLDSFKRNKHKRKRKSNSVNFCDICQGTVVDQQNSLETLKPQLMQFFDYKKNYPLTPKKIFYKSATDIYWLCPKGHGLKQRPNRFMLNGIFICKKCPGTIFKLSDKYPKFAKEFHPFKNYPLTADSYYPWQIEEVFWTCKYNHHYKEKLKKRLDNYSTNRKSLCKICRGLIVDDQNNLDVINPKISKQWNYKKNYPKTPDKIFWKDSKKPFHWTCSRNHNWATTVRHRTVSKSNCPFCDMASSLPELRIYSELSFFFNNIRHRYKILKAEADIYIENLNTIIEYDGGYYHKKRFEKDKEKTKLFLENGYNLIRLREGELEPIENSIIFPKDKFDKSCIDQILIKLKRLLLDTQLIDRIDKYIEAKEFINEALFQELKINLPAPPYKESLAFLKPELAKEWDYEKNYPLKPEHYRQNSAQSAFWICINNKTHPGWKAQISNRNTRKSGCPDCKPDLIKKNRFYSIKKNNIKNKIKNLDLIYDFKKNEIKQFEQISPFSGYIYQWKCYYCNYSWSKNLQEILRPLRDKRVNAIIFCPECKKDLKLNFI
ncbi:zinc-ribbon domain-containing protein [Candidatus Pelagibacter bacterium nBUS_27]|uniref:zinc-ribbon domain-containing protein n=1 Tax=Candidatus Pelagibacter bacterium nBUS_27 TaxID=3374188 RepID=UPI003EBC2EC4